MRRWWTDTLVKTQALTRLIVGPPGAPAQALARPMRNMDDIKSVINLRMVGVDVKPRCKVAAPTQK